MVDFLPFSLPFSLDSLQSSHEWIEIMVPHIPSWKRNFNFRYLGLGGCRSWAVTTKFSTGHDTAEVLVAWPYHDKITHPQMPWQEMIPYVVFGAYVAHSIASSNLILSPEWISSMLKRRLYRNSKSSILGFASSYIFGVVGSDSRSYVASDVPLVGLVVAL